MSLNVKSLAIACAALGLYGHAAHAQTYGFATLPPGTLNHTTASAVAKVLKEKAGMNMLVQPTAGDQVIVPMVARGEVEVGIANAMEVHDWLAKGNQELRIIAAVHPLRVGFFVRKDSDIKTVADLKGKRVPFGFSAMRALEPTVRAMLATANLSQKDIKPVMVPNVVRSADDFVSGAADAFYFAFGAPKVREVDATTGGIRMIEIDEKGMDAARKIERWGYLTEVKPGPVFVGVDKPMKVYSFDNLFFTNAKTSDAFVTTFLDTLLKNQADLISVQPVLREFTPAFAYKQYEVPYHPAAVKYFKDNNIQPQPVQ
ncbi:TAXI family TRAP transporter solute-binding subunit [Pseudorhodoplanes sp.]|uniref:TAXI family TRAP transporter solute-binding subunit n=1 Tax=Pseudorhodoplanes sp. TaxID=1934341 RepID=UPI003918960C